MISNKEIAKQLNISETTLSFIINNKPGVSEKTKKKVIGEIYKLGYGDIFQKRKNNLNQNICFCAYKQEKSMLDISPFFLLLLGEIDQCAQKYGYNTIIRYINSSESVLNQINGLSSMNLSGLLLFATEMKDSNILPFMRLNIPIVALDNNFSEYEIDSVVINNQVGTYKAVEHLVRQGHKKIGYLKSNIRINSFLEREDGYRQALARFNLPLESNYIYTLGYGEEASYQDFRQVLDEKAPLPSAFVSDDDLISVGVARAIIGAGIKIPDQIAMIGFNDRPICEEISPNLTTIQVPKKAFGVYAIDLLMKRIESAINREAEEHADYQKISVGVHLIERMSTKTRESGSVL